MSNKFADLGFEPVETVDSFEPAFRRTLAFEGGNTVDHAGPTNLGVTQDTYNNWRKRQGLPTKSVRDIDEGEAKELYRKEYFEKPGFSKLPANVAGVLFDFGVNAGTPRAAMALQKAVGASPDGVIGPKTLKAVDDFVNRKGEQPLLQSIIDQRSQHVDTLIQKNPAKYKKFENGWKNRINAIKAEFKLSDLNPFSVSEANASEIPQGDFADLGFEEAATPSATLPEATETFDDLGFEPQVKESLGETVNSIAGGLWRGMGEIPIGVSGVGKAILELTGDKASAEHLQRWRDNQRANLNFIFPTSKDTTDFGKHPIKTGLRAVSESTPMMMMAFGASAAKAIPEFQKIATAANLTKVQKAVKTAEAMKVISAREGLKGAALFAPQAFSDTYDAARAHDVSPQLSATLGLTNAVGQVVLESKAFDFMLRGTGTGNLAYDIFMGAFVEGVMEEGTQGVLQNALTFVYDKPKEFQEGFSRLMQGVPEGIFAGALMGSVAGGAMSKTRTQIQKERDAMATKEVALKIMENNAKQIGDPKLAKLGKIVVEKMSDAALTVDLSDDTADGKVLDTKEVLDQAPAPSKEILAEAQKPATPVERAAKYGEVVGIDAETGLKIIDRSVKPEKATIQTIQAALREAQNKNDTAKVEHYTKRLAEFGVNPSTRGLDKALSEAEQQTLGGFTGTQEEWDALVSKSKNIPADVRTPTPTKGTVPIQDVSAPAGENIELGVKNAQPPKAQSGKEEGVMIPSDVSTPSAAPDTANAGKAPDFISDNDISNFIKSPVIPNVKSKYDVKPEDQKTIVEKASNFISKFMGFTKQNPIVSSVGHKIFFAPDERSIARVGEKEGIIEYALHSLTKKGDPKNTDLRVTDNSKMRNIDNLEGILRNPDGYYLENNKVNYYKKISDDKRGYAVAVLENTKDGLRVSDEPLRYVTQLPDRKFVQISNKSTTQATSPDLGSVQKIVRVDEAPPLLDNKNIPQNKNIVKGKGDPASLKPPTVSQIKAAASPQDLEKRIEQLNKFGQANAILRRTATLKKAAGRYDPKANTVKIDEETITSNSSYMEVLGHELGHAIEKNVTGKIQQITSGKKGFELFGEKVDQAKIRAELEAVTEDLVGKARMDDKPEYFYQSTELIARFFEKMIFSHGNLTDLAPTAVNAIELQAIKHPIIQEFLLAATGGIDKGTPKFALLRDMRETYQKHLGKFVGNRAYDQEMVYRAMKERGKIVLEKFINDKMKMIKDSPENLFRAAESIKISRGGKPEFGTRDFAVAKTPEEERDLILAGYEKTPMPVLENGTAYPQYAKQRYTPEEGKQIFDSLSENGKKLIVDFTAERREAKDFFNREVIKETYKIKSQLEGWVHHYFDDRPGSTVMGGQKFKQKIAGARKQRTGTEGYVEDFKKAMTKALVDLEGERVFNEFIPKMLAMVTKPLGQGQTPDPGWIEVVGNIKTGVGLPIEKRATIIDSVTGERVPMKQSRYQMPKEIYERYKLWRGLIDEASTAVRVVNDLNRYWRINILTHPGTSATNFISGGLQFSSKILTDFYREVLTGKLSMPDTQANISAMVKVLLPKGWMDAPDWVYGSDLSNFYGEFMKKKSPISTSIDTYGNKALYMFGAVERYWKKVIMTADGVADLKSLNQMTPEGLRIPTKEEAEMIAAINESVDLYGYDYDNVPQWLEQHQKSVVGQAIKPFAKYPYKYAKQILGMVGEAFDQSKPWQDRVAKVLALATIVSAYAAFSNDRKKKQKTPVADKSLDIPPRLSTRGRVFITTDEKGRELFVRVAKYPFLNLTEAGMQFVDGNWSTGVDVLSDMLGSIGPTAAVGLMAFNYRSKYNQYEKPEVILGDNLATFLPGYRILNDVSRALDPFQRKQETFGQTFTQIIPTTDQALQEKLHGKIRTERVPIEGDVGLEPVGSRTTVDVNLENVKEDILLSLFTGVYRTRLDPKVVEAYIIRKQKNLDKKKAKE